MRSMRSFESGCGDGSVVSGDRPKVSRIAGRQLVTHSRTQVFKNPLQFRHQHRALGNVANASRSTLEITEAFRWGVELPLRARTVMPLVRSSYDLEIGSVDLSDPMQTISDDLFLRNELGLVIHLLKITTAAPAKIRTWRLDPIGRWFDDLFDRSERDAALHSFD